MTKQSAASPVQTRTATIQAIRSIDTAVSSPIGMRNQSPEEPSAAAGRPVRGESPGHQGVAYLAELEPELRAAAIFGPSGGLVECSVAAAPGFADAAARLISEVEAAGEEPIDSCHIASDDAEVFLVREAGMTLVAVADRFVLSSLMTYDIRMTLRDLLAEASLG